MTLSLSLYIYIEAYVMGRDNSVCMVTGRTVGVRIPAQARFPLFHNVQIGTRAHQISFLMGDRADFSCSKAAGT